MRHAVARRRIDAYLDGQLAASEVAKLEAHLHGCQPCRNELHTLGRTRDLLRALPRPERETPDDLVARALAAIAAEPAGGAPWTQWAGRWGAPLAAAAVGVALLTVVQGIEISVVLPGFGRSAPEPSVPPASAEAPRPRTLAFQGLAQAERVATAPAASASDSPAPSLPPMAACLRPSPAVKGSCARWHAWWVGLGMRDAPAFLAEVESLPDGVRDRWLGDLSDFAAHTGAASLLAEELRATGDPRASSWAGRFERTALATR